MHFDLTIILKVTKILTYHFLYIYIDFLPKAKELFNRMLNQNGEKNILLLQLKKAINNHSEIFRRYHKGGVE